MAGVMMVLAVRTAGGEEPRTRPGPRAAWMPHLHSETGGVWPSSAQLASRARPGGQRLARLAEARTKPSRASRMRQHRQPTIGSIASGVVTRRLAQLPDPAQARAP